MSRLRGNLPAYLQRRFGICRRTFERWCAQGDVPGAYRTRGGHWRVRKPAKAMVKSFFLRSRTTTRRDKVGSAIVDYPFVPPALDFDLLARHSAAVKLMLASYGISEEDIWDPDLEKRDPEKSYILWQKSPPTVPPAFLEAVNDRQCAPAIAAVMMRLNGRKVTASSLARALGVSWATLYRRYGKREIRRVCAI
jgi:hypothetical protein